MAHFQTLPFLLSPLYPLYTSSSLLPSLMDNTKINEETQQKEEENDDVLSLCHLQTIDGDDSSAITPRTPTSAQDIFEFFTALNPNSYAHKDVVVFCGKIIREDNSDDENRNNLATFRGNLTIDDEREKIVSGNNRSKSHRFSDSHDRKVNITSLTSMSAKSRRRMFMFGPVKFRPVMEMNEIKQRQSRRAPTTMFPAVEVAGEEETAAGDGRRTAVSEEEGVKPPLGCRAHFGNVLARSLNCLLPTGNWYGKCLEKYIGNLLEKKEERVTLVNEFIDSNFFASAK